jgi:hypothetical protein
VQRRVSEDYAAWIIGLADDTVRNALITQAYHDLSHDMAASLDSGSAANWCTMAAWASRRAGQTIRGEDLPGQGLLTWVLGRLPLGRPICREVARISAEVAAGNREVFAEVAPAFATFIAAPDEAGQAALLRRFRPGPPERGGQGPLRRAFELYGEARRTRAPKRRAELVHAANLYVALQEQTRLQHRIAAAMPLGLAPFITRAMLSLELSGGLASYRMGRDLPARPFPAHLETIEDPELRALILRYDPDIDTTRGSKALRWDRLEDRMRFIVDLFRLHASDDALFEEPLSAREFYRLTGLIRGRDQGPSLGLPPPF